MKTSNNRNQVVLNSDMCFGSENTPQTTAVGNKSLSKSYPDESSDQSSREAAFHLPPILSPLKLQQRLANYPTQKERETITKQKTRALGFQSSLGQRKSKTTGTSKFTVGKTSQDYFSDDVEKEKQSVLFGDNNLDKENINKLSVFSNKIDKPTSAQCQTHSIIKSSKIRSQEFIFHNKSKVEESYIAADNSLYNISKMKEGKVYNKQCPYDDVEKKKTNLFNWKIPLLTNDRLEFGEKVNAPDHNTINYQISPPTMRKYCSLSQHKLWFLVFTGFLLAGIGHVSGSEFPDRECCDSLPPPKNPEYASTTSTTSSTPSPRYKYNTNSRVRIGSKPGEGVITCLEARQQCYADARCRDILKLQHKICGPEMAACSTISPIKCQRLLLSLRSFEFLENCRCDESHIDYNCYTFRQSIFEHPCNMVNMSEGASPRYRVASEAKKVLATCDEARTDCASDYNDCLLPYLEFKKNCEYDGSYCHSPDRQACYKSWGQIRSSPMFGCVCPEEPNTLSLQTYKTYGTLANQNETRHKVSSIRDLQKTKMLEQDSCMDVYNLTHNNPCLREYAGGQPRNLAVDVEEKQELCHVSLHACQQDKECAPLLSKMMMWCEHSHCEPDRQSDNDGQCLTAMRKLHPKCAEKRTGQDPQQCHEIARQCRDNTRCRKKLEAYEKHCATDSVLQTCRGEHRDCQVAVANIFGTELHASCVCKGTDFLHLQDCYTYHKLLWSNPCVIESHMSLRKEIQNGVDLEQEFTRAPITTSTPLSTSTSSMMPDEDYINSGVNMNGYPYPTGTDYRGGGGGLTSVIGRGVRKGHGSGGRRAGSVFGGGRGRGVSISDPEQQPPSRGISLDGNRNKMRWRMNQKGMHGADEMGKERVRLPPHMTGPDGGHLPGIGPTYQRVSGGVINRPDSTDFGVWGNASSGVNGETEYCTIERAFPGQNITTLSVPVHSTRRLMKDQGCSDLCRCEKPALKQDPEMKCYTMACLPTQGCNTTHAVYTHRAPFVQAFRGRCVCYFGKFICQRPAPDQFKPETGVYLYLGYSKDVMNAMKALTLLNEKEALHEVEKLLKDKYGFKCKLIMKKQIDQNLIVMPELEEDEEDYNEVDYSKTRREMAECTKPLEELAKWINDRPHNDYNSEAYLSMFILAEVHVHSEALASQLSTSSELSGSVLVVTGALTTAAWIHSLALT